MLRDKDFNDKMTKIAEQIVNFLFFISQFLSHLPIQVWMSNKNSNSSYVDPFINVLYLFMTLVYSLELSSRI
jgi:hypothetical protein